MTTTANNHALRPELSRVVPSRTTSTLLRASKCGHHPARFTFHVLRFTRHVHPPQRYGARASRSAFTLVELVLVMAIVVACISIVAPTLGNFFRGRTLDSEARRLLSLTHAGQSRAVFEGVPMMLWVDPDKRTYGLKEEAGWIDQDPKAVDFVLDQDLHFELVKVSTPRTTSARNGVVSDAQRQSNPLGLPEIRFLPDGTVDENSLAVLRLYDRDNVSRYLVLATNRMDYEIRSEYAPQ